MIVIIAASLLIVNGGIRDFAVHEDILELVNVQMRAVTEVDVEGHCVFLEFWSHFLIRDSHVDADCFLVVMEHVG